MAKFIGPATGPMDKAVQVRGTHGEKQGSGLTAASSVFPPPQLFILARIAAGLLGGCFNCTRRPLASCLLLCTLLLQAIDYLIDLKVNRGLKVVGELMLADLEAAKLLDDRQSRQPFSKP